MDASRNVREGHTAPFDVLTFWHEERFFSTGQWQWGIQGRDRGGGRTPLIFRPNWGPMGQQNFFWDRPPPLISGCGWFPPYLKVFIRHQEPITRRHWVGWLNSDLKYLLQVLPFSSRRFSTVHADFIAHSLFRSSALTAYVKKKDPFKNLAYRNVVI